MSIEASPYPLGFRLADPAIAPAAPAKAPIAIRVTARALEGMQKEAILHYGPSGAAWRLVCDEGPYLNGTDLSPFPLGFFTAGLVSDYFEEITALARQRGIALDRLELSQDNKYTMEGSAVLGTMIGGALPVELDVRIEAKGVATAILRDLVHDAVAASPANGLMGPALNGLFALSVDGKPLETDRVGALPGGAAPFPADLFDTARPAEDGCVQPLIEKLESADTVFGVAGGAGSSLQAEQKRMLHVRGLCTLRPDGVKQVRLQLFKPIGSVFTILSDTPAHLGGGERAPSGLALLSAGIAFCYMTQIGRYAHIVKQKLDGYSILQDSFFSLPGASGGTGKAGQAHPLETHVHLTGPEDADFARRIVDMGERTCFLHALCRTPLKTRIRFGSSEAAAA